MAWVVRRASGKSLADFSVERIFRPLGMAHTQWRDDYSEIVKGRATAYSLGPDAAYHQDMSFTNVYGNGGLLTTVGDLLVWAENFWTPRVLDRASLDEMEVPMVLNDGTPTIYGLGLERLRVQRPARGQPQRLHRGLPRLPRPLSRTQKTAIAVLSNFGGANPADLAHKVADIVLAGALKAESRDPADQGRRPRSSRRGPASIATRRPTPSSSSSSRTAGSRTTAAAARRSCASSRDDS